MKLQTKSDSKARQAKTVEVWCHAPKAREVFLAGTFNNWNPKATPMTRIAENWKVVLDVMPGLYSYNFVIDGKWVCDPNQMEPGDRPCPMFMTRWLG